MSNKVKFIKPLEVTDALIVNSNLYKVLPLPWVNTDTYALGDYRYHGVAADGGYNIYKSIQAGNIGNTPSTSPAWWVYSSKAYLSFVQGTSYAFGVRVYDPDTKFIYESLTENNTNVLDPISNPPWFNIGTNVSTLPATWSNVTTYALDDYVYYTLETLGGTFGEPITIIRQLVFKSLQAGNLNNPPNFLSDTAFWQREFEYPVPWLKSIGYAAKRVVYLTGDNKLWQTTFGCKGITPSLTYSSTWLKLYPNNRDAMLDNQTATGSLANKEISVTVASGIINAIGLVGVNADTAKITVRDSLGGAIVFQKTIGLSGGNASNGWDYYFSDPSVRRKQAYISGIPPYTNSHVTLELTGGGEIGIGNFILGTAKELGIPENGLSSEMLDFSKKTTDDFGRTTFVKRGFKRTLDLNMFVDNSQLAKVETTLEDVRATPILVIASENPDYSETAIRYCFYKTFRTEISYPTFAFVSIQFEGLI